MNKKRRLILLILFLPWLIAAKTVADLQISGVKAKVEKNIQTRLNEIAQRRPLSSESDEEIKAHIAEAMYPYGYLKPLINFKRLGENKLTVSIHPGPRLLVTRLTVNIIGEGQDNPEINTVVHNLLIKEGKPFNSIKYDDSKQALMNAAEHEGYLHASFSKAEILIDKDSYTSSVTLIFETGPQYYFGQVRFDPTYISPELLHRFVPFKYGQPYSTEQVLAFNNALASSGYFKSVTVQPQLDGAKVIPMDVHLQRASRINYTLGVGYGTDTGPRGRAGLHISPVNRYGHKFNAMAIGSMTQNALQGQYIIPGQKPLIDQYEIIGNLGTLNYDSGYSKSALLSLAQRHNLPNFQRLLSLNGLYERFHYNLQPNAEKTTVFPKATFTWLNKSEQLFTPTGYKVSVNGLFANRAALSEISFAQASVDAKAALTLPSLRTRLYFHSIQGYTQINDVDKLPLSLALLLGGSDNLKAYSYNAIGPGKILTFASAEIQKETRDKWYLLGFFDSGDVYNPTPKNLKHDIGVGLMWVSPIGPIKIGVAQAIDNNFHRSQGKQPKLVISMGPDI